MERCVREEEGSEAVMRNIESFINPKLIDKAQSDHNKEYSFFEGLPDNSKQKSLALIRYN